MLISLFPPSFIVVFPAYNSVIRLIVCSVIHDVNHPCIILISDEPRSEDRLFGVYVFATYKVISGRMPTNLWQCNFIVLPHWESSPSAL